MGCHVHKCTGERLGVELSTGAAAYIQIHSAVLGTAAPPHLSWCGFYSVSCFSAVRKLNTCKLLGGWVGCPKLSVCRFVTVPLSLTGESPGEKAAGHS